MISFGMKLIHTCWFTIVKGSLKKILTLVMGRCRSWNGFRRIFFMWNSDAALLCFLGEFLALFCFPRSIIIAGLESRPRTRPSSEEWCTKKCVKKLSLINCADSKRRKLLKMSNLNQIFLLLVFCKYFNILIFAPKYVFTWPFRNYMFTIFVDCIGRLG